MRLSICIYLTCRLEDHEELGSGMVALDAWDQRLGQAAREDGNGGALSVQQRAFWTNVCICNTLIVERGPDGEYVYQVRWSTLCQQSVARSGCGPNDASRQGHCCVEGDEGDRQLTVRMPLWHSAFILCVVCRARRQMRWH